MVDFKNAPRAKLTRTVTTSISPAQLKVILREYLRQTENIEITDIEFEVSQIPHEDSRFADYEFSRVLVTGHDIKDKDK